MQNEYQRLDERCRRVEANPGDAQALNRLFRAAHDIKGEASTFGFALVERVAASLCRLMTDAPDRARIPFALIAQHVGAVRQALESHGDAQAQAEKLERATARYLADAGRGDDYPNIKGPPLAPRE